MDHSDADRKRRQIRLRILAWFVGLTAGVTLFIVIVSVGYFSLESLAFFGGFIGALIALISYLQSGFGRDNLNIRQNRSLEELQRRIDGLEISLNSRMDGIGSSRSQISDPDISETITAVKQSIMKEARIGIIDELRNSIKEREVLRSLQDKVHDQYIKTTEKIRIEISSLFRRGTVNLAFGIATAMAGVYLLWAFFPDMRSTEGTTISFVENFAPRISLVIFIEVFAYFFLRLYSSSLMEIKYFQNEMTNVESKFLALYAAVNSGDQQSIQQVVLLLAKTERNYILQKGQTTVGLEHLRAEKETITSLSQDFVKAVFGKP